MIRWTLIASIAINVGCQHFRGADLQALLSAACVVALLIHRRIGAAITAAVYVCTMNSAHEFLIVSISVIVALFPSPRQMALLLKVQITVLWVATGFAKLHPNFRSGAVFRRGPLFLYDHVPTGLVIWGTIAIEMIILPALLWWKPKVAFWVALAFQTSVFIGMIRYRSAWSPKSELSFQLSLLSFEVAVMGALLVATLLSPRAAGEAPDAPPVHAR